MKSDLCHVELRSKKSKSDRYDLTVSAGKMGGGKFIVW